MLKRDISTTNVLVAAAGGMIGSGWLFSPYISAQMAGSNALIAWVIAAVFMLFVALPLCELGTMLPISGGMANYPTYTHGKMVGFIFAWTSWISYVVMTPIEIQAVLQYSSHFFPSLVISNGSLLKLSGSGYVVAGIVMIMLVLLNTFGVRFFAECNKYMSFIKFAVPSLAIVSFLYMAQTHHSFDNIQLSLSSSSAWEAIFSALPLAGIIFAFTGFQNGLMLAGEVKNPQRNIPIAILGAVFIGFVLYFLLQLAFLAAVPKLYLSQGWSQLHFPGDNGPLVGLSILLGLTVVATLLLFDAAFSPLGTALVYTAATSRILYGMAYNKHLPAFLLKENRFRIPYVTLCVNFAVGLFSFLPFSGWQKMVAFLSSASILSYGIGPLCLLGLRKLRPEHKRPFKLSGAWFFSILAFYACNLMLYWCGFSILWKLYVALAVGFVLHCLQEIKSLKQSRRSIIWFLFYMTALLAFSYLGNFGGKGWIAFPTDIICLLPFSIIVLWTSQHCLATHDEAKDLLKEIFSKQGEATVG